MTPGWYRGRPMSPHLQIWRWHWTMAASIAHRVTGVGNTLGVVLLGLWITALALGGPAYEGAIGLTDSWFGAVLWVVIYLFTVSVSYHLMNGVRHLVWDAGRGFDPDLSSKVSIVLFAAALLIAAAALVLFLRWQGAV
jgi:succinate dehydrogenase / fumarate reductase cytochrome b subunit